MTHQNLVLTEKAIKNHCKRLQKELKNLNQNLSLGESQNLFSKSLGFNNFHELKNVLVEEKHYNNFHIYEKFVFVVFNLIIDNKKEFAFNLIDEQSKSSENFLINVLFEKYIQTNSFNPFIKTNKKELIFLNLIFLVRKKIPFSCSYFIFLKKFNIHLWNILFYSGRNMSTIKDPYYFNIFKEYEIITKHSYN